LLDIAKAYFSEGTVIHLKVYKTIETLLLMQLLKSLAVFVEI
jgi:hypothetical protein